MGPRHFRLTISLAALLSAVAPSPGRAQTPSWRPFSADYVATAEGERVVGKTYVSENAMRQELERQGQASIIIIRFDRNVMWTILPAQRMYMEIPTGSARDLSEAIRDPNAKVERELLGNEKVGAYTCAKYRVRVTEPQGKTYSGIQWAAKELDGLIVKIQDDQTGGTVEYQNVRLGPPDPALFEAPAGYQKTAMPAGMRPPGKL